MLPRFFGSTYQYKKGICIKLNIYNLDLKLGLHDDTKPQKLHSSALQPKKNKGISTEYKYIS